MCRIVKLQNSMPQDVVGAKSINGLRKQLDKFLAEKIHRALQNAKMQIQSLAHGAPKAQTAGRVCQNKVSLHSCSAFTLFPEIPATGHCQQRWAEQGFLQPLLRE